LPLGDNKQFRGKHRRFLSSIIQFPPHITVSISFLEAE
jgi:hypothetical protein